MNSKIETAKIFVIFLIVSSLFLGTVAQNVSFLSSATPVGSTYFLPQVGLVIHGPIKTTTYTLGSDYNCGIGFFYFDSDDKNKLRTLIDTSCDHVHFQLTACIMFSNT